MKYIMLAFYLSFYSIGAQAGDGHDQDSADNHSDTSSKEEGHHEENSQNVGPEKGITAKSNDGIQLSTEGIKFMDIQSVDVAKDIVEIPTEAVIKVKDSMTVFRVRNGWYKRVNFQMIQKNSNSISIRSSDLEPGDKVVVANSGFLRTAEVYSEEGATHSH